MKSSTLHLTETDAPNDDKSQRKMDDMSDTQVLVELAIPFCSQLKKSRGKIRNLEEPVDLCG